MREYDDDAGGDGDGDIDDGGDEDDDDDAMRSKKKASRTIGDLRNLARTEMRKKVGGNFFLKTTCEQPEEPFCGWTWFESCKVNPHSSHSCTPQLVTFFSFLSFFITRFNR